MRFVRKREKTKISSMDEVNSCGSSSSEADVMTFGEKRKGQLGHGVFCGNIA